jgi:hypothetical protein
MYFGAFFLRTGTSDARQQRAAVAEFFMSPSGSVPWQFQSALVTEV